MRVAALHIIYSIVGVTSADLGELVTVYGINDALAIAVRLVELVSVVLKSDLHPLVGGDSVSHEFTKCLCSANRRQLVDAELPTVADYAPRRDGIGSLCRAEINGQVTAILHLVGVDRKLCRIAVRIRAERRAEEGGGGRGAEVERVSLSVTGKTVYHGGGTVGRFKVAGRGLKVLDEIGISDLLLLVKHIVLCNEYVVEIGSMHAGGSAVEVSLCVRSRRRDRHLESVIPSVIVGADRTQLLVKEDLRPHQVGRGGVILHSDSVPLVLIEINTEVI